jgi:2-hydroxy-3-keto-5-methylthiopentenyl-1-phosphate phosphatase
MSNFLGEKAKEIDIVSNDGKVDDRNWNIIWRDDSVYGNDKSRSK